MSLGGVFLPEIVMEIMSRLPPKSMVRFRSVCKPWCSLFSSPSYVLRNLFPDRDEENLLLVKHYHKTTQQRALSLLSDRTLTELDDEHSRALALPPCPDGDYPLTEILGRHNDLICITSTVPNPRIALWSLATGDVRFLPPAEPLGRSELGFGYDPDSQDYKVVCVHHDGSTDMVEVYSLKSDSWRGVDCGDMPGHVVPGCHFSRACTNGFFSWLTIDPTNPTNYFGNLVLWFRFSDESFGKFRLPPGHYWNNKFFVLNDRICIVNYDKDRKLVQRTFQVWVLLEFGVEGSWTLLFTLGPLVGVEVPLWLWDDGKMIMQHREGRFVLCDPFGQEIEPLEMEALPDDNLGFIQIISVPAKYIYNT